MKKGRQENEAIGREGERKKENKWDIKSRPDDEKRKYRWWMLERKRAKRKKEK